MTDLERIRSIEETIGFELKQVELERITKKDFEITFLENGLYRVLKKPFKNEGARNYSIDDTENVIGLSLDFFPSSCLAQFAFYEFSNLAYLSLSSTGLTDVFPLTELKGPTSLDLSGNGLTDISPLTKLKGLTWLDLSGNALTDVSPLTELKGLTWLDLSGNGLTNVFPLMALEELTSLYLRENELINAVPLTELKGLTSLDLSGSALPDVSFLRELKGLTWLGLGRNDLTDVSTLAELKGLTRLDLSVNYLTDVSFLSELKGLTWLDLSKNDLTDVSFLAELKGLTWLDLRGNKLTNFSFLKELKGLTSLYLSGNRFIDFSFLKELKGLTSLYLSGNRFIDFSFLKELKELTWLDLSENDLTDVSFLRELKGLTWLGLGRNDLTDVSFLKELKELTWLDLSVNYLTDVSFLAGLKGLTWLDLRGNKLTDVSFLAELKRLTWLDLSVNDLTDVSFLTELKGLNSLYLRGNKLVDVSSLAELKGLLSLDLSVNGLTDISSLTELKGLTSLNLNFNDLTDVSFLTGLEWLIYFDVEGNPVVYPPLEIVEQGISAIREYLRKIAIEGTDYIYEAKLLVLGEPGAGKTTFVRKIKNKSAAMPKEEETTRGIDVDLWQFQYDFEGKGKKDITANIWDFGGQAIYRATHRFFLSHRSLYIIMADARKENTDFYYWLNTVELFGEESPAIIVVNEKENRKRDLAYQTLVSRFPVLKDKREVDLKYPDIRLDRLIDKLKYEISHLEHIGTPVPSPWKEIREKIEAFDKKVIYLETFRELCAHNGVEDHNSQDILSEFFHDLGIFLHFKNDDILGDRIFLDKEWILEGAYKIIDDPGLIEKRGRFKRSEIGPIFKDEYSDCIPEIIALMKRFFLVYEKDGFIIAPQMLPYDAPQYKWDKRENIQFQFVYNVFMPDGILWQFIVEMKDYIKDNLVWRYGVMLDFGDTQAEVIEKNEKNTLRIKVVGKRKEDVRAIAIQKIDEINKQFKKLHPQKMVPCVCQQCKDSESPFLFNYKTIINAKNKIGQKTTLQCQESFVNVVVVELLSGIEFMEKENYEMHHRRQEQRTDSPVTPAEHKPFYKKPWFVILVGVVTGLGGFIIWAINCLSSFSEAKTGWDAFRLWIGK